MKSEAYVGLAILWMFILVIIGVILIFPSISNGISNGGGGLGGVFHKRINVDITIERTWTQGIKIQEINPYVSSLFSIKPFFTLPWGGKNYQVTIYVSGPESKVASNTINLRLGEIKVDTLGVSVDKHGTYNIDVVVTDAVTGDKVAESSAKVVV